MVLLASLALAAPSAEDSSAFTGAWRLSQSPESARALVDAAIETTLAPFNMVIRGLARGPLHDVTFFCEQYDLRLTAESFRVGCDSRADVTGYFGRSGVPGVSAEGKPWTLDSAFEAGVVTFLFHGEDGWQRVRYRVEGGSLVVEKTVHADRLDADVRWTLRYGRR